MKIFRNSRHKRVKDFYIESSTHVQPKQIHRHHQYLIIEYEVDFDCEMKKQITWWNGRKVHKECEENNRLQCTISIFMDKDVSP